MDAMAWETRVSSVCQRLAQDLCNEAYHDAWMKQKKAKKVNWKVPEAAEDLMELSKNVRKMDEASAKAELLRIRLAHRI
jgi:hypothetical protein